MTGVAQAGAVPRSTTHTSVDRATGPRVRLLAWALATTAVLSAAGGMLWPEPAGGGDTYAWSDVEPVRHLWWGLLFGLAVVAVVSVTLQALAVVLIVRGRGHAWATGGAVAMVLGIAVQATGVAGWASAYYYPTAPSLDADVGRAVVQAVNDDQIHLFGPLMVGALLVVLGTIAQCVGLLRSRSVPRWVPVAGLSVVLTLVVPGSGALGLVTAIPMAAAAIALGWLAVRAVDPKAHPYAS